MFFDKFLDGRVAVKSGDITREKVDAIVNAANSTLFGGGGVDGAIHRAGGASVLEECRDIRRVKYPDGLPTGEAFITSGGNLPARFVIHTVGPIYAAKEAEAPEKLLANCYKNSLRLAVENDLKTIAFPSISTGAFGYAKNEAARVSSVAIKEFLDRDETLQQVLLIFFSDADARIFLEHQQFNLTADV
ncbi:MAG: O-acetyl-ADP-ribose deacetylase [Acidobacteria bacterium]|jgi:O-acetyl-ADP-ribose deacetylase (regulator of RNase III)|nr:O-acetyl-ADP-ribose deacetylase [Acidobacteriota bacterium]